MSTRIPSVFSRWCLSGRKRSYITSTRSTGRTRRVSVPAPGGGASTRASAAWDGSGLFAQARSPMRTRRALALRIEGVFVGGWGCPALLQASDVPPDAGHDRARVGEIARSSARFHPRVLCHALRQGAHRLLEAERDTPNLRRTLLRCEEPEPSSSSWDSSPARKGRSRPRP